MTDYRTRTVDTPNVEWLDAAQAANFLGLSEIEFRDRVALGVFPEGTPSNLRNDHWNWQTVLALSWVRGWLDTAYAQKKRQQHAGKRENKAMQALATIGNSTGAEPPDTEQPRYVYFIQAGNPEGSIKIGSSADPDGRLAMMQTGNHDQLVILGVVEFSKHTEKQLHKRFAKYRLHGEWFRPDSTLMEFIKTQTVPWDCGKARPANKEIAETSQDDQLAD